MDSRGASPCAAVPGTTITVEDLFFSVPARQKVEAAVHLGYAGHSIEYVAVLKAFKKAVIFFVKTLLWLCHISTLGCNS